MKEHETDAEGWTRQLERRRWTASEAKWALERWTATGGALAKFARGHGIDPNRLIRWRGRLQRHRRAEGGRAAAPVSTLVPVTIRPAAMTEIVRGGNDCAVVVAAGNVRLEIRELNAASRSWVAELLGLGGES